MVLKKGDRVRMTKKALEQNLDRGRSQHSHSSTGIVVSDQVDEHVKILKDGLKTPSGYHVSFWEPYDKPAEATIKFKDQFGNEREIQLRRRERGIEFLLLYDGGCEWGDVLNNDEAKELKDAIESMLINTEAT